MDKFTPNTAKKQKMKKKKKCFAGAVIGEYLF